jgi:hypothetical protein
LFADTIQHSSDPPDMRLNVFAFDFGEIKLLKKKEYRFYYCYAAQGGFFYLRHVGTAIYDDIMNNNVIIVNDDSWINGAKLFSDLRWVRYSNFTFETHHKLSRDIASLYEKKGRYFSDIAAVCNDDFEFGMQRMSQSLWEDDEQALWTVRDPEAAVEFLKIDWELLDRVIAEVDRIEASESV